ncbi:MAG: hypothetical protein EXX96DRAFT_540228 [Benjaminiella poitrasii]|nr:MAG: hypothetical protein EXX96DRAFT_540228 [Benjaminiella poitrasii]
MAYCLNTYDEIISFALTLANINYCYMFYLPFYKQAQCVHLFPTGRIVIDFYIGLVNSLDSFPLKNSLIELDAIVIFLGSTYLCYIILIHSMNIISFDKMIEGIKRLRFNRN